MIKSESKIRKNIPASIRIITGNEVRSKKAVAEAMAEMYRRMLNPI